MSLALYIFACLGNSFFGKSDHLKNELADNPDVDIEELFGSIPKTLLTVVQFFTYDDAMGIQRAIGDIYPVAWLYFMSFLVFICMGMLELMTSIFIDSLLEEKKKLEMTKSRVRKQQRRELTMLISGLFETFDTAQKGYLDTKDLEGVVEFFDTPSTEHLLESVEIDKWLLQETIRLSDLDGDGMVTIKEFEGALNSINESVTKADVRELTQRMIMLNSAVESSLAENKALYSSKVDAVEQRLARIERLMEHSLSLAHPGVQFEEPLGTAQPQQTATHSQTSAGASSLDHAQLRELQSLRAEAARWGQEREELLKAAEDLKKKKEKKKKKKTEQPAAADAGDKASSPGMSP